MDRVDWSKEEAHAAVHTLLEGSRSRIRKELLDNATLKHVRKIPRDITVDFFEYPTTDAGMWYPSVNMILFNKTLLDFHGAAAWCDIVAHEVGHIVTDSIFGDTRLHGKEWKAVARWLGCKGTWFHEYDCDHIFIEHPDKFFLYFNRDDDFYVYLTHRQHVICQNRGGVHLLKHTFEPYTYKPHLVDRVKDGIKDSCVI